jgi:hypothetical protein
VILRGGERQDVRTVDHDDEARLLAGQEFLDDHAVARAAEAPGTEHVLHRRLRGREILGEDDALARGEPVGLDHDGRADPAQIGERGLGLGEDAVGRRRDAMVREEVLGEGLRALELCGVSGRSETAQTGRLEGIDDARNQRCLRADDGQVDRLLGRKTHQCRNVVRRDRQILHLGLVRGSAVAGRNVNAFGQRRLCGLPGEGMLAPAIADDQDLHTCHL